MPTCLSDALATALHKRHDLLQHLHDEGTDCYRLFHGSAEGQPGLTVDRYGTMLLAQSFHRPLSASEAQTLRAFYRESFPDLPLLWNDRSTRNSRIHNPLSEADETLAREPRICREMSVNYRFQARHAGQDPWLFLDLRAGRRRLMQICPGKSMLNLFAYTCGAGIAAASAGAAHVVNIDFAESALAVGRENARLNALPVRPRFVKSDFFPAVRQLAGLGQAQTVRGKRLPPFPQLTPRQFDLVLLDPPRYARSPYGVVDLVRDYPTVFKPALLATAEGGQLLCCNNVARVEREAWLAQLQRSAYKAGRPIREVEWIAPEADFPSPDGLPPLKMVLLRV